MLDLDETLVHASALPMPRYDFSFSFPFGGVTHTMYVRKRPFLEAFFNHLRLYRDSWEVVIFTASARARTSHRATPPRSRLATGHSPRVCTPLQLATPAARDARGA